MKAIADRIGLAALGAAALTLSTGVMLLWYLGYVPNFKEDRGKHDLTAEFAAVPQLQEGDPVRVDGRLEGRVTQIADIGGGRGARVTFNLGDEAGPIYRDAIAELRWKDLLGGSFYLEIDRGTRRTGPIGDAVIPRAHTRSQVEVDDVTTIFEGRARNGLTTIPRELSRGLREPRKLTRLLDTAARVSPSLTQGLQGVRGVRQDEDLRALITGSAGTVAALDAPRDGLRRLVGGAAAFVGTTARRTGELRSTLRQGPELTQRLDATLARLDVTLGKVDGLAGSLQRSARSIAPTLAALRPTIGRTATLLDHARPLVANLEPATIALATLARSGLPLLTGLQPSFDRLDDTILPKLAEKDPQTGKPTSVMIGGTAAGFGGAASQQDENGHFIRFPASGGSENVHLPCHTSLVDPTVASIAVCESFETALKTYLQYIPNLSPVPGGTR